MPSISRINGQLKRLASEIDIIINSLPTYSIEEAGVMATALERLARAQKALIETQVIIFIEATESDLDMPELPLFVEEREDPEPEGDENGVVCYARNSRCPDPPCPYIPGHEFCRQDKG